MRREIKAMNYQIETQIIDGREQQFSRQSVLCLLSSPLDGLKNGIQHSILN